MWRHYISVLRVRRFERLLAGLLQASRRKLLEDLLSAERLKLLGRNAGAVNPARLFRGSRRDRG
jgi:hypothetical protein